MTPIEQKKAELQKFIEARNKELNEYDKLAKCRKNVYMEECKNIVRQAAQIAQDALAMLEALNVMANSEVNKDVPLEQRYIAWAHWLRDEAKYLISRICPPTATAKDEGK